ncbi:hypothetical protein HS1genome_1853 [Sulfodiicoccus acidiphilus]|uniref:DUF3782 domain-containing protein n=1 Tax=Sulfodiicoccus acidiphilus TaxID=1670455 RepID=A0A348B5L2_9CREN|nr:DUF3782 domain-containing protein [Sulfodiicoccus acidiphilus]BBD73464.1 hypothetical protein HS1genome_1853 [Sulfodiicoccus acidiphilus]GGT92924.1 hypothetical protein GCM10007116_08430 [Sulfodiicoccus acidiphilus]
MALKADFLKLLREDEEFRKELTRLLGEYGSPGLNELREVLKEVLGAVNKLTEAQLKWQEEIVELRNNTVKLEESVAQLAEAQRKSEESMRELAQAMIQLTTKVENLNKSVSSMGQRWGVDYEELIRDFFQDFAEREGLDFSYVNKFTYKDDSDKYGKKGRIYEVEILAKDGKVYLIEVKSFVEEDDVEWFDVKTDILTQALNITNPVKLMLGVNTTDEAVKAPDALGIRLIYGDVIEAKRKEKPGVHPET